MATGRRERLKLPASNVIQLCLAGGSLLTFRPSGTEPKLKIYLSAAAGALREALTLQERLEQYCQNWVKALCSLEGA